MPKFRAFSRTLTYICIFSAFTPCKNQISILMGVCAQWYTGRERTERFATRPNGDMSGLTGVFKTTQRHKPRKTETNMKNLKRIEPIAADAPSATTTANTETPKEGLAATTTLPDPERGDRLTTKCEDFRLVMRLFPKGEVKEMLHGLVRWVVGESESDVYAELENTLSPNAMFMLKTLVDGHKKRSRQYRQQVETKALRALRRFARARRTK